MNKVGTAYILWLGMIFGLAGLHRLYNGKIWTGLLWLCSGGLFGVGQLIDLILIPKMVEAHNVKLSNRLNASTAGITLNEIGIHRAIEPVCSEAYRNQAIVDLLKAAEDRGGQLSVTQGVIATGLSFFQVQEMLQEMLRTGYVEIGNDPETGVVVYDFKEM